MPGFDTDGLRFFDLTQPMAMAFRNGRAAQPPHAGSLG
jgi:hypothetical protein